MNSPMDKAIDRSFLQKNVKIILATTLAALTILFLILHGKTSGRSIRVPEINTTINSAARENFHDLVPLRGKVVPHDTIYLDANSGGRITKVLIEPGDKVTAGQPLVEFNNTSLQLQVIQQESQLNQAITQLQSNEITLEQNKMNNDRLLAGLDYNIIRLGKSLTRREILADKGFAPQEAKDNVQDELNYDRLLRPLQAESNVRQEAIRQKQLPLIEDQLQKLKQNLVTVHEKLEELVARAPISGKITDLDLNIGENKNQGDRLATIVPDTGYKITASVDEYYLSRIHVGQQASIELNHKNWTLQVFRVYPQVKSGSFQIDLIFQSPPPPDLLPGQAVQGRLTLGEDTMATVLPAGSFLERTGGDWVFVVAADERSADRRHIKIGRRNADQVEILDGLQVGEKVITSDYSDYERVDHIELTK